MEHGKTHACSNGLINGVHSIWQSLSDSSNHQIKITTNKPHTSPAYSNYYSMTARSLVGNFTDFVAIVQSVITSYPQIFPVHIATQETC